MANADSVNETVGGKPAGQDSAIGGAVSEVKGWPARTKLFLADVRAELKRVSWPTMAQVKGYSGLLVFPYALLLPPVALVHMLLKPWNHRYERTAGQRMAHQAHQREMKLRG